MTAAPAGFRLSAGLYLVAAVLVEQHQHQCHDDDDRDHDGGVEDGVDGPLAHGLCVFAEWSVQPARKTDGYK